MKEIKLEILSLISKDTPDGNIWLILDPIELISGTASPLLMKD
jgi:hypothetical protein